MDNYENQASGWLAESAGYFRQFYFEKADSSIREYVRLRPGCSLLIAGISGLIAGAVLRCSQGDDFFQ